MADVTDTNPGGSAFRRAVHAQRRESPRDLPHGNPVPRSQLPLQESPEVLQFVQLLQDIAGRLDRVEGRVNALPGQNPGMTLQDRQKALRAARRHVNGVQAGRLPMPPADRIKAEVLVAWFLVGEHVPDPE